jgi:beta-lactamase regulating signal transducer with metallopeptidase domain/peptidoglycan/xylan/chitin deacetylase (PgdA/CDA1 family)
MNLNIFTQSEIVMHLGWALVHSFWQLALIAAILFVVLRLTIRSSPNVRYLISVCALLLSVIVPVMTYLQISERLGVSTQVSQKKYADEHSQRITEDKSRVNVEVGSQESDRAQAAFTSERDPLSTFRDFLYMTAPSFFPFAVFAWLLGMALFSFRLTGGLWKLHEYKTTGVSPVDGEWQRRFAQLSRLLAVDRKVILLRSSFVNTPIAVGFLKPLIIVPTSVFLQMDPGQLESIIAHELIHIRRYDCLVNIFQSIAEILFFYHPAVWWISAEIRREREFAADAAVLNATDSRVVYATALANLEEIRHLTMKNAPSIAMAANGGNLMQRIQRILDKKTEASRANSVWSTGMALALTSVLLLALFSFSPRSVVNGQKRDTGGRKLAIGFVSIPPLDRSTDPPKDADATARLLIAKLQQYKVPAIGFLSGGMVSDGEKLFPVRANIVRMWRDAGFDVGIGGFKHLPFRDQPLDAYIANVEKNERVAKQVLGDKNTVRYFSYPYLYTRNNDDHQKFEKWLSDRGLTSVKYTIDNNEWIYSYAYDVARMDNDLNTMKEVRSAFIDYMAKMFDHYEMYSVETFGREIPETMVLTPSRLVTDTADDLFGMIKKRGYSFVSMETALADPAFQTAENYEGESGISWFDRWTLTAGKRLKDEPEVAPFIQKMWDKDHPANK